MIFEHVACTDVAFIRAETEVDLGVASWLLGRIADGVECAGRNTIDMGKIQALLHEIIEDAGGIDAAESTAFQNQRGCAEIR